MGHPLQRTVAARRLAALALLVALDLLTTGAVPVMAQAAATSQSTDTASEAPGDAAEALFIDRTEASGLDFVHWNGMTGRYYFPEVVGSGAALFDMDGDGDLDLYLVQGGLLGPSADLPDAIFPPPGPLPLHDRLYRNDLTHHADGSSTVRWTDVTEASGLVAPHYGMGVAAGDADNDGRVDLYVTNFGPNQLWRNRGPGADGQVTFEDATEAFGVTEDAWSVPASFADLDADGWLDLFVGNYMVYSVARNKSCVGESGLRDYCGPQSYEAAPDTLFHNRGRDAQGRVRFDEVSQAAGLDTTFGPALGAITADFDGDGRIDLYVGNDLATNQLWLNQGADPATDGPPLRFFDDALLLGAALNKDGAAEASMGMDAADVDGDGDEDLFMTHLTRESNTLYVNDGQGLFRDQSLKSGLANPSWGATGFGTAFLDVDNDGWLDLLSVNGSVYVLFELARQGDPYPLHQPNQLFRNLGPGDDGLVRFEEISQRAGTALTRSEVSRGAVFGDLDNDGDTDVVITNNSGPARMLLNTRGQDAPWLGLRLVAGDPARDQLGARVAVHPGGGPPRWRRVRADGSFASANDPRVLVGLGGVPGAPRPTTVDKVVVHWLDGSVETWPALATGRYHTLAQGTAPVADDASSDAVGTDGEDR